MSLLFINKLFKFSLMRCINLLQLHYHMLQWLCHRLAKTRKIPLESSYCRVYLSITCFVFYLTLPLPDEAICDTSILFNSVFSMHDFSVTIPRCYKDVYVNNFFHRIARLWNSWSAEYSSLNYNLNGFHSRVSTNLLPFSFSICFPTFSFSVICNSMPCSGCYVLRGVSPNWKNIWKDLRETKIILKTPFRYRY